MCHCSSNTVDYFHPGTVTTYSYPLKAVAAYIENPASNIKTHPPLFFCFSTRSHAIIFHAATTRLIHLWYRRRWWNAEFLNRGGKEIDYNPKYTHLVHLRTVIRWCYCWLLQAVMFFIIQQNWCTDKNPHCSLINLHFRQGVASFEMFTHKQYNANNIVPDVAQPLSVAAVFPEDVLPQLESVCLFFFNALWRVRETK